MALSIPVIVVADGVRTHVGQASDTVSQADPLRDFALRQRRMSMSAYPVELKTMGRALRIRSDYAQLLPIYTETGTLYMALRITKGTNWLNGLPRGKYFINNQPVTIN
ncbi:MAG: hypothetical protein K5945_08060 [Bacteroidaceae bacterium]|nr:hypothetical protein [Bacteroidaceae bacterium]